MSAHGEHTLRAGQERTAAEPREPHVGPDVKPDAVPDRPPPAARNVPVLLVFTAVTNLADGVTKIALPLLAARASGSPAQVAAVSLTLSLPWLLAALHVGVLVDRVDRRRLLWAADALRLAALGAVIPVAVRGDVTVPVLCAAGAALGVAEVVALTSAAALVPALTPPAGRERANAWIAGAETVCNEFCGPFAGGLLLAAGTGVALGVTWVSYLAATAVLVLLVGDFRATAPDGTAAAGTAPAGVNQRIAEGVRHLWHHTLLRTMALILTVLCACWGAWLALMPLYATEVMRLGSREYGTLLSALGVGGLVGALVVTRANRYFGRRRVMFADLVGTCAMMAVPALTGSLWAVAGAAFAGGLGGTLWTVNSRTIAQQSVPGNMLGRYHAVSRLFSWGAMPLGAGLMGLLAQGVGFRAAFAVFAASVALTVVPFVRVLTRSALDTVPGARDAGPDTVTVPGPA
ncbi:MFS transporter [Streptomyces sp. NPDC090306]|uniref:MFS transporter n=1 Tax=Streptomyces sp. NPDC090306 TaxID=3365961 RepID=UPI00381BC859